jgi:molybdopterin-guanine dinucleotide biosynthesis protein A
MRPQPIGVVLAGGSGRRIGGDKALVELDGRPLATYPLAALRAVLGEVAVCAKGSTRLPDLPATTVWLEPEEPRHPLAGIVYALELARGRPIVVCAVDLALVTTTAVAAVAHEPAAGTLATVAQSPGGESQPLLARYEPEALARLREPARQARAPLREVIAELAPAHAEVDAQSLFNVNSPPDVLTASAALAARSAASRT